MAQREGQDFIDILWGLLVIGLFVLILAVAMATAGYSQNIENQPIASQYSTWQVQGYAPDTYSGFAPTSCRVQGGASFFNAFTVGVPIMIVDGNPALTEIVTPSQVTINNSTCSIVISSAHHHNLPFYLTSATGGLQEALDANIASPTVNTIILDGKFYASVGSTNVASVIASVVGFADLGLIDVTQTPYAWYAWNGSQYVKVAVGGGVTSVFGRTGTVVAESGDYDCAQITGCGTIVPPNVYLNTTLSAGISATAMTIPLTSVAGLNTSGEIIIGSEWIGYTGISGNSLTGATRGMHLTAAASYSSGTPVYSVVADFTNPDIAPSGYITTNGSASPFRVFNCDSPDVTEDLTAQFNCDADGLWIKDDGGIEQLSGGSSNIFESIVGIGPGGGSAAITNSGYLFDSTRQNQSTVPQGFGAGLAGPVESIQPLTIGAPTIINFANTGSTTWSYECTGTDVDGHSYPGTVASVTNGPTTITSGEIIVSCPFSAGAETETIWRTAGGPNQGSISVGGQPWTIDDFGASATPGSPPATNSSIPKICTGAEQYCQLSGTTSTPTVACGSGTAGWTFHNVSATVSPFAYVCNGTNWVTAY